MNSISCTPHLFISLALLNFLIKPHLLPLPLQASVVPVHSSSSVPPPLVSEEKVLFGVIATHPQVKTASDLDKLYNPLDVSTIRKEVGIDRMLFSLFVCVCVIVYSACTVFICFLVICYTILAVLFIYLFIYLFNFINFFYLLFVCLFIIYLSVVVVAMASL